MGADFTGAQCRFAESILLRQGQGCTQDAGGLCQFRIKQFIGLVARFGVADGRGQREYRHDGDRDNHQQKKPD